MSIGFSPPFQKIRGKDSEKNRKKKSQVMEILFENYLQDVAGAASIIIQTSKAGGFSLDY